MLSQSSATEVMVRPGLQAATALWWCAGKLRSKDARSRGKKGTGTWTPVKLSVSNVHIFVPIWMIPDPVPNGRVFQGDTSPNAGFPLVRAAQDRAARMTLTCPGVSQSHPPISMR